MTSNIIRLDEAARDGRAANRVGGTTHGTLAAHQPETNLGRSAPSFVKMNAPQIRQDDSPACRRMAWLVLLVSILTAGLILSFGPGLIAKAAESVSFYANY